MIDAVFGHILLLNAALGQVVIIGYTVKMLHYDKWPAQMTHFLL